MFSAMTDGSLSTMPRPRAYTSVFAVPRSMARSLATRASPVVGLLVRRQRLHLALERVDALVERRGVAVAHPQHQRADRADDDGDQEEGEPTGHWSTSRSSVAARPQSS